VKYTTCSEYIAAEYPAIWEKINSVLTHEEHPTNRQHWPPFHGMSTRNPFLNIVLHYVEQGKIKNPQDITKFIETGTCTGTTSMHFSSMFETVDTVEKYGAKVTNLGEPLPENHYENIQKNFANIKVWWDDSPAFLEKVLTQNPDKRAVFLLDAHNGTHEVPLLEELDKIKKYSKTGDHVILIDDGVDCGREAFPSFEALQDKLLTINNNFTIEFTNHCRNVIIAY